jgi:hypothetical protein
MPGTEFKRQRRSLCQRAMSINQACLSGKVRNAAALASRVAVVLATGFVIASCTTNQPSNSLLKPERTHVPRSQGWTVAATVPGMSRLSLDVDNPTSTMTCWAKAECDAIGNVQSSVTGPIRLVLLQERAGTWSVAKSVPNAELLGAHGSGVVTTLSCVSSSACSAGGFYTLLSKPEDTIR